MKPALAFSFLLLTTALPAHAVTITVESVFARVTLSGTGGDASSESSTLPVAVASAETGGGDPINDAMDANAYQASNGVSSIKIGATTDTIGYSGNDKENVATGVTQIDYRFFNDGPFAIAPTFTFTLTNIMLETVNAGSSQAPEAMFEILANTAVQTFTGNATLLGIYDSDDADPEVSGTLGGSLVLSECAGGGCYKATFTGSALTRTLSLGTIAPGAYSDVFVLMSATTSFFGYETGARVEARDPNGGPILTWSFDANPVSPNTPSPVPLPASAVLLGSALAAAGLLRRRRT